jgi:hypothetical protein
MEGNPSGFLTEHQSLDDYATKQWVEDKGYITGVDIPASAGWNEATTVVNNNSAIWNNTTNVVSSNSAQWGASNPQIPVTGINGIKISESGDQVVFEVSGDYATTAQLADKQDITGMTAYQPVGNYQTAGDYLTTADSANFYTTANESGFITGVDLTPYQEKADMTAYATVESLTAKQDAGDYLSATDSANFLLTSDSANFYPMNENPSGYLTAHQSLTDYQLTADMTGYLTTGDSANFLTGVPAGTMNESAFEYDANDKISGYNGSAFAGGSDVPEGVMVESGLEYNAVNEISAYNGSAIAQYGAEKQWLVHDDTLVHAANSAQYALGVNLSAVAQLLGVDETVLFSGSTQSPNLTDSIWNYKKVLFLIGDDTTKTKVSNSQLYYTDDIASVGSGFSIFQTCKRKDGGYISMGAYINVNNGGSGFTVESVGGWVSWDNSTCTYN